MNTDGTVTGDAHDQSSGDGWASLTFDTVTATGLRIGFSGTTGCCNHYHVYEFEAYFTSSTKPPKKPPKPPKK